MQMQIGKTLISVCLYLKAYFLMGQAMMFKDRFDTCHSLCYLWHCDIFLQMSNRIPMPVMTVFIVLFSSSPTL